MSEKAYVPDPPLAAVEPFDAVNAVEDFWIPEVVVMPDPPLTAISGLTLIVIFTFAVAPTLSVAVIVSR